MRFNLKMLVFAVLTICSMQSHADTFVVEDIEVDGLQRITAGTVFTYLPVKVGDTFDEAQTASVIRELFATGFFADISLTRRDNVLVVVVEERPSINDIRLEGNRDLKTEDILTAVRQVGLAKGRIYSPAILEQVSNELRQQYFARGKYNANIDVNVERLPRNRVDVVITVREGEVARIRKIAVVGNESFDEAKLIKNLDSGVPRRFMFFSKRDHYSRQKLAGDLEKLRSHYLDGGFLHFNITSTQVSITPDRKDIFVTVNIDEGQQYTVSDIAIAGAPAVPEEELRALVTVALGDVFSRRTVTESAAEIAKRLGDEGYAFANVNPVPDVDEAARTVALTFFIDPGRQVYIRRINFTGNTRTNDEVYRREMRQMEGALYSTSAIERSRVRIQRLSYVESANIETRRVAGADDQIDLEIAVTERLAGNLMLGAGFSQSDGFLLNINVTQENFMGTGKRVALNFNNSSINRTYSVSYLNPYHTEDGVSRGFGFYFRETDAAEADISRYSMDRIGANVSYGIPVTEYDTLRITPKYEWIEVTTVDDTPKEISDYLRDNDDAYNLLALDVSYTRDTRDRTLLASRGGLNRVGLEVIVPGSDLTYAKLDLRSLRYIPLGNTFTLALNGEIGYGEAYGDTTDLPFFEKYLAGGSGSVRGYKARSLGPLDSNGDPYGGNFRLVGNAELIFPAPFVDRADTIKTSLFLDAGHVYATYDDFEASEIRMSAGVGMTWLSPVGALTFSLAKALNEKSVDETETFQFNLGAGF